MSKVFTVIFFKDGTHEYHESKIGLEVQISNLPDEVISVYNAISKEDAEKAISLYANKNNGKS